MYQRTLMCLSCVNNENRLNVFVNLRLTVLVALFYCERCVLFFLMLSICRGGRTLFLKNVLACRFGCAIFSHAFIWWRGHLRGGVMLPRRFLDDNNDDDIEIISTCHIVCHMLCIDLLMGLWFSFLIILWWWW